MFWRVALTWQGAVEKVPAPADVFGALHHHFLCLADVGLRLVGPEDAHQGVAEQAHAPARCVLGLLYCSLLRLVRCQSLHLTMSAGGQQEGGNILACWLNLQPISNAQVVLLVRDCVLCARWLAHKRESYVHPVPWVL